MPESLQQRIEKIRLWAKDPDRAASRILATLPTVLVLVAIALWVVWIVPKHQVRNSFGSYLNADIAKQTELETARRTNTDKTKQAEIEAQLNANATQTRTDSEKALELEDNFRKTLTQIVLSIFGLVILYFTWQRARTSDNTVQIMEQGQITDRFTKAIEQLGKLDDDKPNLEVRLGAIYALERIARDSPRDHWTIMEVLTAYVRQNSSVIPFKKTSGKPPVEPFEKPRPRADIQAILTVLGRRLTDAKRERPDQQLDLSFTDLRGADLMGGNFQRAYLIEADLRGAYFTEITLRDAVLNGAILRDSDLASLSKEKALYDSVIRTASQTGSSR